MIKRILAAMVAFVMIFSCLPVFQASAAEIAPNASGTTYYVSSLHGAEGNNGTSESTPFASLLKINEITLQPGDRVCITFDGIVQPAEPARIAAAEVTKILTAVAAP